MRPCRLQGPFPAYQFGFQGPKLEHHPGAFDPLETRPRYSKVLARGGGGVYGLGAPKKHNPPPRAAKLVDLVVAIASQKIKII